MKSRKKYILARIRRRLARMISRNTAIDTYFNVPFKFYGAHEYIVNERVVEVPFVFSALKMDEKRLKILDFGCANSWLPVSLASLGHDVYAVDLRDYPFEHQNLVFKKQNILTLEEKGFDVIIAVSSLEHVGLKAYGSEPEPGALDKILSKLNGILADKGILILTVPVGEPFADDFMRSFAPGEIEDLVSAQGFFLEKSRYFQRIDNNQWLPCAREKIREVSNRFDKKTKGRYGTNGVGCLVFRKPPAALPMFQGPNV